MSARYAGQMTVTAEFRDGIEDPDTAVAQMMLSYVASQGLTPVSDVALDWHEITQREFDMERAFLLPYGTEPAFRAGDWRVRGVLTVAEDPPDAVAEHAG